MLKPALPLAGARDRMASTATSRRRSSGLSSYDDTAYNMFGGDEGQFSHQYMVSKWKKEARQQFEEAHGKRRTTFQGDDGDGEVDSYAEDVSEATTVEPGEVRERGRGRSVQGEGSSPLESKLASYPTLTHDDTGQGPHEDAACAY